MKTQTMCLQIYKYKIQQRVIFIHGKLTYGVTVKVKQDTNSGLCNWTMP